MKNNQLTRNPNLLGSIPTKALDSATMANQFANRMRTQGEISDKKNSMN